jgi:hypothetical protein
LEDGGCGTFIHAQATIDAFNRVDYHKVWTFVEGISRAYRDTVSVFTLDTVIGYDKRHDNQLLS